MKNIAALLILCAFPSAGVKESCPQSVIPSKIASRLPMGLPVKFSDSYGLFFDGDRIVAVAMDDACAFRKWIVSTGTCSKRDVVFHDCSEE